MGRWPLNVKPPPQDSSGPTSSPSSLAELCVQAYVENLDVNTGQQICVAQEVEDLPTTLMVKILEEFCERPHLIAELRKLLLKPPVLARILQMIGANHQMLVKCLQWVEIRKKMVIDQMASNFSEVVLGNSSKSVDEQAVDYINSLKFGTFLVETGWYKEALKILNAAMKLATNPTQRLGAMKEQLVAQVCAKDSAANSTSTEILTALESTTVPEEVAIGLYLALSIHQFENYKFKDSYRFAVKALSLLDEQKSTTNSIIEVFRRLAKTCISQKQLRQAKLIITQAVSRAWHSHGSASVIYAKTLEDYAFYLVMMNAVDDSLDVFSEAQAILLQMYGPRNLQQTVTQGNLTFGVYLQAYIYRDIKMAKLYVEHARYLMEEMNASDHRLLMAIKRVDALIEADIERFGMERDVEQRDGYQMVRPQLPVAEVRKLFEEAKEDV